jgi:hypothetical protein
MFVHYAAFVHVPLGTVERRLDALNADLFEWAGIAYRDGESLRARVGPHADGFAKEVRLEIGEAEIQKKGLVYPIKWIATGASSLFPTMTADLVLSHAGAIGTRISFEGTYEPPMGPLGKAIDRVALRRFAESTVRDWVDRIAGAVATEESIN